MVDVMLIVVLFPFVGLLLGFINKYLRHMFLILVSGYLLYTLYNLEIYTTTISLFGFNLYFAASALSSFFSLIIFFVALMIYVFTIPYLKDRSQNTFYFLFSLLVSITMLLVMANDIISFFVLWELMSLFTFLIPMLEGRARKSAVKYMVFSLFGAYSMLTGFVMIYSYVGGLSFDVIGRAIATMSLPLALPLFLIAINFMIKGAIFPFYTWAPDLYEKSQDSFTLFLSAVLSKLSVFGIVVFAFKLFAGGSIAIFVGYLAGITMIIASIIAIFQDSAKRLLAYSSIANVSYALLGIMLGGSIGFYGGMLHVLNHTLFKGVLFLVVAGVIYRTGTDNLNELGGLIKKMPFSFVAMLMAIIATAGVPPMNGFVSKWMIYSSLLHSKQYFFLIAMFVSSTASFLYVYRLIHAIFLGQIQERYANIKELPIAMILPIAILSILAFLTGVYPGLLLDIVNNVAASFGVPSISYTLSTITIMGSTLNAGLVSHVFMGIFAFTFLLFVVLPKTRRVSQYDNYNAGQVLTKEQRYHYSENFYNPLFRVVRFFGRFDVDILYIKVRDSILGFANFIKGIYSGDLQNYLMIIVFVVVMLLYVVLGV